ncbi:MAG: carboxypeptidase-like regulatory domain-containing protein [Thermoplasmatota archaeon]
MTRRVVSMLGALALTLVFLMLSTALFFSFDPGTNEEPVKKAAAMQTWPSGTLIVNVTDDVGRPLTGATVKTWGDGISWQNLTAINGTVALTNLTAGESGSPVTYQLNASAGGYRDSYQATVDLIENETAYIDLTVYGGFIQGTVTTISGGSPKPVTGANVTITPLGYSADVSPADGFYQLAGIPANTYSVTANASGYVPSSLQAIVVPLGGSVTKHFVLISQNGSISGHVYCADDFSPLDNTNVSVQVGSVTLTVSSGSDGSYNITNIPEGIYSLTASKDGFFSNTSVDIRVTRGNVTAGVDFNLTEKPTRLYGIVKSGSFLLVGVNISVVGTEFYSISGIDGNFAIWNLTAGTYTVLASRTGYSPKTIEGIMIPAGGETQLEVNLTAMPGSLLQGTVIARDSNSPLSGVLITIIAENKNTQSTYTNINGEFVFPGLMDGNYTIQFEKDGYRPLEIGQLEVRENDTTNHRFFMNPLRRGVGEGFIFGFDMAHSMMILALFLTIVILAVAVYLRIRTFQAPESAPAVYDEAEEEVKKEGEQTEDAETAEESSEAPDSQEKKVRKIKKGGE